MARDDLVCLFSIKRRFPASISSRLTGPDLPVVPPLHRKAVLFQYDVLAGSGKEAAAGARTSTSIGASSSSPTSSRVNASFQPLSPSGEKLVDEITGVLGKAGGKGNRFQEMSRSLIADLKDKMGATGNTPPCTQSSLGKKQQQQQQQQHTSSTQDSDPKAKYLEKVRTP